MVQWSMRLPAEEEARAVAVGLSWVAASTSLNHLRVFSEGGLQVLIKVHDAKNIAALHL